LTIVSTFATSASDGQTKGDKDRATAYTVPHICTAFVLPWHSKNYLLPIIDFLICPTADEDEYIKFFIVSMIIHSSKII